MKTILINPEDIHNIKRISELNPFAGLAYIASYIDMLFGKEISVEIIEMLPQSLTIPDVLSKFKERHISICGITSKTYNFSFALKLASEIKEISPETIIIFGGAHATALPYEVLQTPSIDAVISREGEVVFSHIVKNILSGHNAFENVKGALFKDKGEIINNGPAELINNLDELPFPDWQKYYNLDNYDRLYDYYTGQLHLMIPIFSSRGCPYRCQFCQPVLTRKYRSRSVSNVIDEVQNLAEKYKVERIYFEDSVFGIKKEWFSDFCQQYIDRGLHRKVTWGFESNVNNVDLEKLRLAVEAGCVYIYYGLESASDQVLLHLGKNATKEKNRNAIELAKKAGIREVSGSFIFGLPYETSQSAEETLEFIRESKLDNININLLDIYPGTEIYGMVEQGVGGISWIPEKKDKWDECGRTLVKTYVNDLDSIEKLEGLYLNALQILREKYRRNYYNYVRRIIKLTTYYCFHNPRKIIYAFNLALASYFPGLFKLN